MSYNININISIKYTIGLAYFAQFNHIASAICRDMRRENLLHDKGKCKYC